MKITKEFEIIGKGLWLKKDKTLIISDLHIGYEEALNKRGILIPRTQFQVMKKEIQEIINGLNKKNKTKLSKIIILGDLKHEFGEISTQEWNDTLELLKLLKENAKEVILVQGNHDKIVKPITELIKKIKVVKFYCMKDICFLHGDEMLEDKKVNKSKIIVIGHEHPAIKIKEGPKIELYKCFLYGRLNKKKLIVLPSFLPLIEGSDIRKDKTLSPYLKHDLGEFKVYVLADKAYDFGMLKNIE